VLAAEHLLDFAGLDLLVEGVECLRELRLHRLSGVGPLLQHGKVVAAAAQREYEFPILLEPAAPLQDALGFGLVLPEVRRGSARLETGQFFVESCALKDSSADPQRDG
jgi:hypothetical protein